MHVTRYLLKKAWFLPFFLLLISNAASASSCWNSFFLGEAAERQGKTVYELASEMSQYIFIGEATFVERKSVRQKGSEEVVLEVNARFRPSESLKGAVGEELVVNGSGIDCHCVYDFEPGVEYFVLADKDKKDNKLYTHFCKFIGPKDRFFVDEFRQVNKKPQSHSSE